MTLSLVGWVPTPLCQVRTGDPGTDRPRQTSAGLTPATIGDPVFAEQYRERFVEPRREQACRSSRARSNAAARRPRPTSSSALRPASRAALAPAPPRPRTPQRTLPPRPHRHRPRRPHTRRPVKIRTGGTKDLVGAQTSWRTRCPVLRQTGRRERPACRQPGQSSRLPGSSSVIRLVRARQRTTRAERPAMRRSTSGSVAMDTSPGVVIASAPWATP